MFIELSILKFSRNFKIAFFVSEHPVHNLPVSKNPLPGGPLRMPFNRKAQLQAIDLILLATNYASTVETTTFGYLHMRSDLRTTVGTS